MLILVDEMIHLVVEAYIKMHTINPKDQRLCTCPDAQIDSDHVLHE